MAWTHFFPFFITQIWEDLRGNLQKPLITKN